MTRYFLRQRMNLNRLLFYINQRNNLKSIKIKCRRLSGTLFAARENSSGSNATARLPHSIATK